MSDTVRLGLFQMPEKTPPAPALYIRLFQPLKSLPKSLPIPWASSNLTRLISILHMPSSKSSKSSTSATPSEGLRKVAQIPDLWRYESGHHFPLNPQIPSQATSPTPPSSTTTTPCHPVLGFHSANPSIPDRLNKVTCYTEHACGYDVSGNRSGLMQLNVGTFQRPSNEALGYFLVTQIRNRGVPRWLSNCSTSPRKRLQGKEGWQPSTGSGSSIRFFFDGVPATHLLVLCCNEI